MTQAISSEGWIERLIAAVLRAVLRATLRPTFRAGRPIPEQRRRLELITRLTLPARGVVYSKIPRLQFPVDDQGRCVLVQDVTYYSKAALFDALKAWRDGGETCSGRFDASTSPRHRARP